MNNDYRYHKLKDGLGEDGLVIRARIDNNLLKGYVVEQGLNDQYYIGHYSNGWNAFSFTLISDDDVKAKWLDVVPENCKRCETRSCNECTI